MLDYLPAMEGTNNALAANREQNAPTQERLGFKQVPNEIGMKNVKYSRW